MLASSNCAAPATVLIVEDHELLAQSLSLALAAEGMTVEIAPPHSDGVLQSARSRPPSVVLLDLDLGAGRDPGEALLPPLVALGAAVLIVSAATDELRLGTVLELGAKAVISKSRPFSELVGVVLAAARGDVVMRENDRQELLAAARRRRAADTERLAPFLRLTPRESEVLSLLMKGDNAESIAAHFFVSDATVRTQIRGVLTKLEVGSQLAAVARAHRAGWSPVLHAGRPGCVGARRSNGMQAAHA